MIYIDPKAGIIIGSCTLNLQCLCNEVSEVFMYYAIQIMLLWCYDEGALTVAYGVQ